MSVSASVRGTNKVQTGVYRVSLQAIERESRAQLEPQLESTGSSHRLHSSRRAARASSLKSRRLAYEQQQCWRALAQPYSTERAVQLSCTLVQYV
uniref:Uncharacterized protein n=1 Tax=Trichogramma kaykai TaxID=54128 RepID=A0ABD2X3C8_9HYME